MRGESGPGCRPRPGVGPGRGEPGAPALLWPAPHKPAPPPDALSGQVRVLSLNLVVRERLIAKSETTSPFLRPKSQRLVI